MKTQPKIKRLVVPMIVLACAWAHGVFGAEPVAVKAKVPDHEGGDPPTEHKGTHIQPDPERTTMANNSGGYHIAYEVYSTDRGEEVWDVE